MANDDLFTSFKCFSLWVKVGFKTACNNKLTDMLFSIVNIIIGKFDDIIIVIRLLSTDLFLCMTALFYARC